MTEFASELNITPKYLRDVCKRENLQITAQPDPRNKSRKLLTREQQCRIRVELGRNDTGTNTETPEQNTGTANSSGLVQVEAELVQDYPEFSSGLTVSDRQTLRLQDSSAANLLASTHAMHDQRANLLNSFAILGDQLGAIAENAIQAGVARGVNRALENVGQQTAGLVAGGKP
jgi:hypothetical protein